MKDKISESHRQDLPPCPFSAHCLRLVDALDGYHVDGEEDQHETQFIEQLRVHVLVCPICRAALEEARHLRAHQRQVLREMLAEGEQQVPSTTAQILLALKKEQQRSHAYMHSDAPDESSVQLTAGLQGKSQSRSILQKRHSTKRTLWRTAYSLVAAVIVILLASAGVFGYFARTKPESAHVASSASLTVSSRWSSVVMTSVQDGDTMISLYDPQRNKSVVLAASNNRSSSLTSAEVSHDGTRVLYSSFDGKKTIYYLRTLTATIPLYMVSGNKSQATWSTDDRYVFVSAAQGIEQIDVKSKAVQRILPETGFVKLQDYRDGYLYYVNSQDNATGVLNRADIVHGNVQPVTTDCTNGKSFWLSPSGGQVYYVCEEKQNGLFVVNSDGTNAHVLRTQAGSMIGYAADESPLTLVYTGGKYQVVKLADDESQDQPVLDNVVPDGGIIPPGAVAVAPFGYTLVARAIYDNYEAIWYGDLTSGKKQQAMKVEKGSQVGFYGWSRMQVP
jgi:hypothetical protein